MESERLFFFFPLLCVFYECTWLDDLHSSAGKSMRNDRDCTLLIHRLLRSPFLLFCCFFKLCWKCSFTSRKSASIEGSLLFQLLKAHETRQVACFSRSMYELSSIAIGRKRKKKNSLAGPISGSVEDNCRSDNSCSPLVTVPSESEQFKAFQRQIVIDTQRGRSHW